MSNKTKLRLRIFYDSKCNTELPWKVQEKGLLFWRTRGHYRSENSARNGAATIAQVRLQRPTGVVGEYTEEDHTVEVLKSEKRFFDKDVNVQAESAYQGASLSNRYK